MCTAGVEVDYLICVHVLGYAHLLQRTHVVVQRSILARLPGEGVTAALVIGGATLRVGDSDCCGGGVPAAPPSSLTDRAAHTPMIEGWLSPLLELPLRRAVGRFRSRARGRRIAMGGAEPSP